PTRRSSDLGEFPRSKILLRLFPVDDRHQILVHLRGVNFKKRVLLLGVVGGEKTPSMRRAFAVSGQVIVETWHLNLKSQFHMAMLRIYRHIIDQAFEILLVGVDRYICLWNRYTKPCS